jgi:multisubunit Na+/H+ antiporter MnhF subunit
MDPIDIFIKLTILVLLKVAIGPDITAHLVGTNMHYTVLQTILRAVATTLFGLYCVCSFLSYLSTCEHERSILRRAAFRDELEFTPCCNAAPHFVLERRECYRNILLRLRSSTDPLPISIESFQCSYRTPKNTLQQ